MKSVVHLLNEIGMLTHVPRSGFALFGTGNQSVAEHSYRMALIAYILALLSESPVDLSKLLLMCLFHDLPEARTNDLNYLNKRYVKANESAIIEEFKQKTLFGNIFAAYLDEYIENRTLEALLAHDADQLEMLLVLKELHDIGNPRALKWFDDVVQRLKTKTAQELAKEIYKTPSDEWWYRYETPTKGWWYDYKKNSQDSSVDASQSS